jgi:hypothetical protein
MPESRYCFATYNLKKIFIFNINTDLEESYSFISLLKYHSIPKIEANAIQTYLRNSSVLAGDVVLNLVDLLVLRVDGTDEHVVRDVLQVTAELQPRSGR